MQVEAKMMYITVVGARKTPAAIIQQHQPLVQQFVNDGFIMRSGNATGFDQIVSSIPAQNREIYLPYPNFGMNIKDDRNVYVPKTEFSNYAEAKRIVKSLHPNKHLSELAMQYLARDVYQVLGKDLHTPSEIVYCWTEDGASTLDELSEKTGGTAMAIRVALANGIKVVNLNKKEK